MLYGLLDILQDWLTGHHLYRYVMVFDQLGFRAFLAGVVAFAVVIASGPRAIRWLREKKIGDTAQFGVEELNEALSSKANTPTMGGLLISAAIAGATLLMADLNNRYIQLALVVLVWHAVVGGVDDWLKLTAASRGEGSRQGLFAWEKLVFQLGVGLLAGYFAHSAGFGPPGDPNLAHAVNLPFQKTYLSPSEGVNPALLLLGAPAYIAIMTIMMAGMSNAVNITDGMDGLASGVMTAVGVGVLILCFIAGTEADARWLLVPYVPTSGELAVVVSAMIGASLGFLWFNCSPASVFMGDTGSLTLGGLLGYLAVVIRQEFVVVLMAGVFIFEILSVVIQVGYFKYSRVRFGEGRRVFRCAPYHWHLRMGGWPEPRIVARLWIISVVLVAVALATLKLR